MNSSKDRRRPSNSDDPDHDEYEGDGDRFIDENRQPGFSEDKKVKERRQSQPAQDGGTRQRWAQSQSGSFGKDGPSKSGASSAGRQDNETEESTVASRWANLDGIGGKTPQKKSGPSSRKAEDERNGGTWQDETQRGLLIDELYASEYECIVCCNAIKKEAAVWSCSNCYHIYHLYCIKKWAHSPSAVVADAAAAGAWRCPTCQNAYFQVPNQYNCFCGRLKDPVFNHYIVPHSCGDSCNRERHQGCPHPCNVPCHPGPCPPCTAFVTRSCLCGKTKQTVRCAAASAFKCAERCAKTLNCGRHDCPDACHDGACEPCSATVEQKCFCGAVTRRATCGTAESFATSFSCHGVCRRALDCGSHECGDACHPGPCRDCRLLPDAVTCCPCGKTELSQIPGRRKRKSCVDEIPTCGKSCEKELQCGSVDSRHRCKLKCHDGACPVTCDGTTEATCRCGGFTKEMPCREFVRLTVDEPLRCERRCNKKMSCGRHKCSQLCCVNGDHRCQLVCGYKLTCGLHKCEETCHKGNCASCWQVSFEELRCHCGSEVIYPPVPCGTKAPECHRPCLRQRTCEHKVSHACHSDDTCPPCTVLTEKWCMGRHELRRNLPCYLSEISCGLPCGKELPCMIHKCQQTCHKGPCLEGQQCVQPCPMIRPECGHPCQAPCHPGCPCPATVCRADVTVQCDCGHRKEKTQCLQGHDPGQQQNDYGKMTAQLVASKLWEGQSIDLGVLSKDLATKKATKKIQCNPECAVMERNQRLALALEIKNPDLSGKLGNPSYSQFLKDYTRQNATFVAGVEKSLSDLVTATHQKKTSKKSHAFKSMPSVQRRLIHELAEFYGCQTESYDEEPNKNVVATALRDKCWLPSITLTALIQREFFPKAPLPIPINCAEEQLRSVAQAAKQSTQVFSTTSATASGKGNSNQSSTNLTRRHKEPEIDYFDQTE